MKSDLIGWKKIILNCWHYFLQLADELRTQSGVEIFTAPVWAVNIFYLSKAYRRGLPLLASERPYCSVGAFCSGTYGSRAPRQYYSLSPSHIFLSGPMLQPFGSHARFARAMPPAVSIYCSCIWKQPSEDLFYSQISVMCKCAASLQGNQRFLLRITPTQTVASCVLLLIFWGVFAFHMWEGDDSPWGQSC